MGRCTHHSETALLGGLWTLFEACIAVSRWGRLGESHRLSELQFPLPGLCGWELEWVGQELTFQDLENQAPGWGLCFRSSRASAVL